jgi:predicted aldo/keto reductase-like oxidoreductase
LKYRKFRKLEWKISALGFGAMRLPILDGEPSKVDEVKAISMIRYAIDHGVNYIDTAYPYHGGNSEVVVGKALKKGYREKVKVATKMPVWLVNSQKDMDRYLNEQLKKLKLDYLDFYLLHGLRKTRWVKLMHLNVFEWLEKAIEKGKIGHVGFSFHDDYDMLKKIVDSYDAWTLCQIQYNYLDTAFQAGTAGLKYAASKGLNVAIMEPLAGGLLAVNPPKKIQAIWNMAKIQRTAAEWALQWVWNHPEVSVALSGMSTMNQVIDNIQSANRSGPGTLTDDDQQRILRVREMYYQYGVIRCSGCGYCLPCTVGVDIPQIFTLYNAYYRDNQDQKLIKKYHETVHPEKRAKRCVKCGRCEERCPQELPIRNILGRVGILFESSISSWVR